MHVHTPGERDAPVPAPDAGVSFVMPVLNEERYLDTAVASVLAQEVDGPFELILALGPSTDGTDALAQRLAAGDDRIRLISFMRLSRIQIGKGQAKLRLNSPCFQHFFKISFGVKAIVHENAHG